MRFNLELPDWEMHRWWWERDWSWVDFGCSRGIEFVSTLDAWEGFAFGSISDSLLAFVCRKFLAWLEWYRPKQIEWLDTIYARCKTSSSWLLCDQKVHDSLRSSWRSEREPVREFFLDPPQWWDHGSEKVTEHESCQRLHMSLEP
jgi:hypothetical protein